jgi:glyceraldehyde 3-phosphate dehydrogenase
VHGRFPNEIKLGADTMDVGNGPMRMFSTYDPMELDWSGVDVVLECTGKFNNRAASSVHLERGAKRVLNSAPAKMADKTIVYGVNHDTLSEADLIVSNASCTTNCLAPIAKVMHDAVGIEKGFMTTIHSYTGDQPTLDRRHSDLYRARAAAMSLIPTTTGAAKAVGLVMPELEGRLDGSAIRVPTPNVSAVDLKFIPERDTSVEEINAAVKAAATGPMKGILEYVDEPTVSIDYNHNSHSSNFASLQTTVMGGNLVRILSWYDNEWGFSCRMADTAVEMGKYI